MLVSQTKKTYSILSLEISYSTTMSIHARVQVLIHFESVINLIPMRNIISVVVVAAVKVANVSKFLLKT